MPDYSQQNQFELAELKLTSFSRFLDTLIQDESKRDEAIEKDKHIYYDYPPFVWQDFSKFLIDKIFNTQNIIALIPFIEELKDTADKCIIKYSKVMGTSQKEIIKVFKDFPKDADSIGYSRFSFKLNIEFCVKTFLFAERMLPQLKKSITFSPISTETVGIGSVNPSGNDSGESSDDQNPKTKFIKNDSDITTTTVIAERIFHGDQELAEYLGCSTVLIWKLKRQGLLPYIRVGWKYTYKQFEIDNALHGKKWRSKVL